MKYIFESWSIMKLIDHYNKKLIELNPPYQRNDIWSLPAKKRLIDTILKGYPLPAFFLYRKEDGTYDCVDGQQRIRTIFGFNKDLFPTLENLKRSDIKDPHMFEDYLLPIIIIEEVDEIGNNSMEDFYYRVNMYGSKLNRPEILRSRYFNSPLQNLIEQLTESDEFRKLELFTESRLNRMIDYDFVGELVVILTTGITDKKLAVDRLFEDDSFTEDVANKYEKSFHEVLKIFLKFNHVYPIKETRYKQRNDFYTLFYFVKTNKTLEIQTLLYIYKLLVLINDDIVPSNENCYAFQEYAFRCVSQSNSKQARDVRYEILKDILLNKEPKPLVDNAEETINENLCDVLKFYKLGNNDLKEIEGYYLIDIEKLKLLKSEIAFYE